VLGPYTCPQGPVCITQDSKTLVVTDKTDNNENNVFVYSVDGDTYTLHKSYRKKNAWSAYLDEDTQWL
jgi:hypothetical protein